MHLTDAIQLLQQHSQAIAQLTGEVTHEQAVWKPSPDSWSMLEVMCHLADEERETGLCVASAADAALQRYLRRGLVAPIPEGQHCGQSFCL